MSKYLFIDGNNLAIRSAFADSELHVDLIDFDEDFNPDEAFDDDKRFPTSALHGFFKSLIALRNSYPEYYIAVVWDGGHQRRIVQSQAAVSEGIIPSVYKANRKVGPVPPQMEDWFKQKPILQKAISLTNIPQIIVKGEEADDVIASFASRLNGSSIVVNTTDKDYFQILRDKLWILRADNTIIDTSWFKDKYGIEPQQWIDVGALQGDSGDNIFGIPGWGEVTAIKQIKQHGDWAKVLAALHEKHDGLREKFPDVKGEEFVKLADLETGGEKPRKKYPGIQEWMPFTGVALAVEEKRAKMPKTALMALIYESRVSLAYDLKKMKVSISLPELPRWERQGLDGFRKFCDRFQLKEVSESAETVCAVQP
jgi:5'-3' exonuclease